jgi:DNA-binding winged helix-turn-helix (wHTH) protein/TolB-like protein
MQKLSHQVFSFSKFTLDLRRGCLLRAQEEIKLRPKSFEVLKYLVENNGRLISKDELIHAVWVETAVTDDSLVQCLKDIRHALSDETQQIIKTVHGRGYIFDTEVRDNGSAQVTKYTEETAGVQVIIEEQTDGHEANQLAAQTHLLPAPKVSVVRRFTNAIKRYKLATAIASVALVALVIAAVVFAKPILFWWFKPPSIAVLPIVNATGDPNNNYIVDGLTESLITSLNQINEPGKRPRLLVTAQGTVFIFRGKEIEPRSVGRELGVDTVVASQMIEQNGLWIIKVEMINVANGSEMWRKQYPIGTRGPDQFLKMQDEIPSDVAGKLPLSLSDAERQRLTRRYTQNPAAYDAYLKGRAAWFRTTPEGYRKSIEYYQQAIDLDPNFALPYWGMGLCYSLQAKIGLRPYKEASEKATDLYLKALKIDNTLRAAKGALELGEMEAWNWEAIEKAGPLHLAYHFGDGGYLIAMGRLDEQLAFENRGLALNPHGPGVNFFHGETLFLARQYDAAIAQYQKTLNLVSGLPPEYSGALVNWIHSGLGQVYLQKGMFPEGITEFNKARDLTEDLPPAWEELGYADARSGQRDEAIKILNQLQERAKRGEYVLPLGIAWIYIGLGDKDQAFVWLDKSFEERSDGMREIKTNPIYDPLRSDPRFSDLLKRMHLPT